MLSAAVAAFIMATTAPLVTADPCSAACQERVKAKTFAEMYGGCRSQRCVARVRAKRDRGSSPRQIGRRMAAEHRVPWSCVDQLIHRESGWRVTATNRSSGAYGLPQSLPGHKMAAAGPDWRTSARTQLRWFFSYVKARYGGACAALGHWQRHHWY